jgi:hypothetical protein
MRSHTRACFLGVVLGGSTVASCRNTIVEQLGDAGIADSGGDDSDGGDPAGEGEGDCPHADLPALSVQVIADDTSFTVCEAATVSIVDDTFSSTAVRAGTGEACRHEAAHGRPGTYVVTASATGYRPATLDNLVVAADGCGDPALTRQVTLTLMTE